jgi:hypothetical protein
MAKSYSDFLDQYGKVAFVFILHAILIVLSIAVIYGLEKFVHYLWGEAEPLIYGRYPLKYLFQTIDVAIVAVFGFRGVKEMNAMLRG